MKTHVTLSSIFLLLSFSVFGQLSSAGLVAYYPFNGYANDASKTINHATTHGATLTTDRFNNSNQAYLFNGSSDRLQAPENDAYDFGDGDFSITSWVSLNEIKTARIVSAGHKIDDGIWGLGFGSHPVWGSGLRINYFVYSGGAYRDFSSDEITGYTLGRWAMVGITKTGNTITFYYNGKKAGTASIEFVSNAGSYLSIGSRQDASGSHIEFLNGKIDEVRIYKRGLSETEISEEYNSTRNNLVVYLPFNGNADDESGNGHDGNVNGGILTKDRFYQNDQAYTFPNLHNNIVLQNTADMNLETGFTISAWVKYKNINSGIVGKHNCWVVNGFHLGIDNGQFRFLVGNSGWSEIRTNESYLEDKWYNVTSVFDSIAGTGKVYIDGVLKASGTGVYNNFSTAPITISEASNGCPDGNMPGAIDEVKIYDRPLTDAEIMQEYDSTRNSLVAYFPFNGNASDESGNGNNGTITGQLVTPTADRFGEEGKAYKFWYPDYVSVPTNTSFFTDEFTVSYWHKVGAYWGDRGVLSCVGNNGGYQQAFYGTTFQYYLMYNWSNPGDKWFWSNYTLPNTPNTWQHITTTYKKTGDNASVSKLYVNGELKSSDTYANVIGFPGGEIFYIGRNQGELGFNGELDDVRFYSRMLTDAEVLALHIAETPTAVKKQIIPDVRIAPNPSSGYFAVDLGTVCRQVELSITDLTGRVVKTQKYTEQQLLMVDLDAPAGIYFLNITTSAGQGTFKLIRK